VRALPWTRPGARARCQVVAAWLVLGSGLALLAGCAATAPAAPARSPAPRPAAAPAPPRCAWYSPTVIGNAPDGQQVIVSATGPACRSLALVRWIAARSGKPWAATTLVQGTDIAQLAKGGTVVRIWQTGFAPQTDATAGFLADDFQAAGWAVQVPEGGGPGPPAVNPSPVGSAGIASIPASARST